MSKNADRFEKKPKYEKVKDKIEKKREERRIEVKIKNKREDKTFWQWFCSLFSSGD